MGKRVLRAITRLNIGGPARQALMLTRDLEPDFHTDLIAGTPDPGEGEISHPEVKVERAPLGRSLSPRRDLEGYRFLRECLLSGQFDLVHTHMAKAGALTRCAALRIDRTPKLVHTFHGHVFEGYFNKPVQRTFIEIEKRLARHTDALVAVSSQVRDDLLDLDIGSEDRWHVVPLGFDLSEFLAVSEPSGRLREYLGLTEDVPLVGVLGRLAPIKNHTMLLDAIARINDVHLAILGDGELRERIIEQSRQLGIAERVHMVGWWLDVSSAIADLDVVVLTSRNEGTPVSLIEAAASGKPVVSTDVGGVRAVVKDGITGLLVPSADHQSVAEALERLLTNADMRVDMGAAGREHVRDRFNKRRLIFDIKQLYGDLLGQKAD
jgi:glycosyltransferase involved in cell wall biosynthesis